MKKTLTISTVLLASFSLAACGNNNSQSKANSSLKAENSSLKASSSIKKEEAKYNNSEYAIAAYLKFHEQDASDLQKSNIAWNQKGNKYALTINDNVTTMTVNSKSIEVSGNDHKTYTKEELLGIIKKQRQDIDDLLASAQQENSSSNNSQSTQTSKTNSSSNSPQSSQSDDSNYNLPLSDPRNPDGAKQAEMMSIAGDPQYRNTPDGSVNSQGQALMSSIRNTMHNN
ncbi:hypothetical protein [Limosilactobacillus vaginalis]